MMTDDLKNDSNKLDGGFNPPNFADAKSSDALNPNMPAPPAEGIKAGQSMAPGIPKDVDPNRPEVSGAPSTTGDMRFGGAEEDPVKKQELGKLNLDERNAKSSRQPPPSTDQDNLRQVMERKELSMSKRNRVKEILRNNGMDSMQQVNAYNQLVELLEMDDSPSGEMSKSKLDEQKNAKDEQELRSTGKTETEKLTKH